MKEKLNYVATSEPEENLDNDLKELELFGKVKKMDVKSYKIAAKFGKLSKGERKWKEEYKHDKYSEFNKNGFIFKKILLQSDDIFVEKFEYEFNQQNKKMKEYYYGETDEEETLTSKTEYIYNNNVLIELNTYSFDNEMIGKTDYNYKNGLLIEEITYNENGDIESKTINIYNDNNLIDTSTYNIEGNKTYCKEIEYDEDNNISCIKSTFFYKETLNKIHKIIYQSFKNKLLIEFEEECYNKDYSNTRIYSDILQYEYEQNKLVAKFKVSNNSRYLVMKYEYDVYGNIAKRFEDEKVEIFTWEYKYDSYNNWIEQIEYRNSVPQYIIERIIEYYE